MKTGKAFVFGRNVGVDALDIIDVEAALRVTGEVLIGRR
jgi:hypothetical protein